jgi:hypothetical protein
MDEELRLRITTFFQYWRQRYEFIHDLDIKKNNHEANVLLWASFDALSNLWEQNIGKKQCRGKKGKRLIFDSFLAHYGGEIFQIVSLADIWNRVDRENISKPSQKTKKLSKDVYDFLSKIGDRPIPTLIEEHRLPRSSDDWSLEDIEKHQLRHSSDDWSLDAIITATLRACPVTNRTELEEWLIFSRYGAIAYKEMRSAYIHEGRSGKGAHGFELHESATRPTYRSGVYVTPPKIGFKAEFMLGILVLCIDAFEADALTLQQDPVPERQKESV